MLIAEMLLIWHPYKKKTTFSVLNWMAFQKEAGENKWTIFGEQ